MKNNLFDLKNRVAVITGGNGLLGKKHAEAISEFGGIPISLDIAGNEESAIAIHCDITQEKQIKKAKDQIMNDHGRIDILINNATINPKVEINGLKTSFRLEDFSLDQWNMELSVGLTGAMLCSKIFGSEMAKNKKGVILNIASDLGVIAPDQRLYGDNKKPVTYSVVKHGLIGLTKYLATYWSDKGIRCNSLCPGGVYVNQSPEFVSQLTQLIPLGRMADVNEYKAAIVFLVSDASSYMTGANLIIDGGRTCW